MALRLQGRYIKTSFLYCNFMRFIYGFLFIIQSLLHLNFIHHWVYTFIIQTHSIFYFFWTNNSFSLIFCLSFHFHFNLFYHFQVMVYRSLPRTNLFEFRELATVHFHFLPKTSFSFSFTTSTASNRSFLRLSLSFPHGIYLFLSRA